MDLGDRELEAEAFEQGYLETLNEETAALKEIQRKLSVNLKRERAKRAKRRASMRKVQI